MTTLAALACRALDSTVAAVLVVAGGIDAKAAVVARKGSAAAASCAGTRRADLTGRTGLAAATTVLVVGREVHAHPTAECRSSRTNNRANSGNATVPGGAGVAAAPAVCRITCGLRTGDLRPAAAELVARAAAHAAETERANLAGGADRPAATTVELVSGGVSARRATEKLTGRAGGHAGGVAADLARVTARSATTTVRGVGGEVDAGTGA